MNSIASSLRKVFNTGKTKTVAWRKAQLDAVSRMMEDNSERFIEAQVRDFRTPLISSVEVAGIKKSCSYLSSKLVDEAVTPTYYPATKAFPGANPYVIYEPYGVVLVLGAWNYPLIVSLEPALAAIACGNAVVLKPSELASNVASLLAELAPRYLDNDVIKVVTGGPDVASDLLKQKWDFIAYTGGTRVGKIVYEAAAKHLTPVLLELGGKSPVFVSSDADIPMTAAKIIRWKLMNAGQTCVAPDYVLVEASVKEALVSALKTEIVNQQGENNPTFSRIVNEAHLKRLQGLLKGERIIVGGTVDVKKRKISPTLLDGPDTDSAVMQEEIFGPILPIVSIKSATDAIEYIKARSKPLALYVFTTSPATAEQFTLETSSGGMCLNDCFAQIMNPNLPMGGVGDSGIGRYTGRYSLTAFSHLKGVHDTSALLPQKAKL